MMKENYRVNSIGELIAHFVDRVILQEARMTTYILQKPKSKLKSGRVFLAFLILFTACAGPTPPPTSTPSPTETAPPTITPTEIPHQIGDPSLRAMWIWDASVIQDAEQLASLFEFTKDKKISVLYVYAGDVVINFPDTLANFIKQSTNNGLKIELLFGEPGWTRTENHALALALIDRAITFSEGQPADQQPVGIHIDVEPYGLSPDWDTNRAELIVSFLDLIFAIKDQIKNANVPLRFSADIPFWFDTIQATYNNETRTLNQFVQDMTDQIVLMDYRNIADGEDGFIALGQGEILYAEQVGKLVTIGLETTFQEPAKLTFFGSDENNLEQEIGKALPVFSIQPAFDGIAIHDYVGYQQLITGASGTINAGDGSESCKERKSIGKRLPNAIICSLQYTINNGPTQTIYNNGVVAMNSGDVFTIVNYTYFAPDDTPVTDEKIAAEAYIFKTGSEPDYTDGRFTPRGGAVLVIPGEHDGGIFLPAGYSIEDEIENPGWKMEKGWSRLIVVLVHYYPPEANEKDDRFYIMFSIR